MFNSVLGNIIMAVAAADDIPIEEPVHKIYSIALRIILAFVSLVVLFKAAKHLFASQPDWVALGWELAGIVVLIIGIVYVPDLIKSLVPAAG